MNILLNDGVLRSAMVSKMAYTTNVDKWVQKGFAKCNRIESHLSRVHICYSGDRSLVAGFRGSQHAKDFLINLNIQKETFCYRQYKSQVHHGFMAMFKSIEPELTQLIYKEKPLSITFCGHSMGGAVATIASAYYGSMFNKNKNITCHSFASPLVGDKGFSEWFQENVNESRRVVLEGDLVPLIPIAGYQHIDDPIHIDLWKPIKQPLIMHDLDTYLEALCVPYTGFKR